MPSRRRRTTISDDDLLADIQRVSRVLGRTPSRRAFNRHTRTLTAEGVTYRFRSWNIAVVRAGMRPNERGTRGGLFTDEQILHDVRRVFENLGRAPTEVEFTSASQTVSGKTAAQRLGGWSEALERAGAPSRSRTLVQGRRHDYDAILTALRDAAAELGEPLRQNPYGAWATAHERPAASTVTDRYGTFEDACEKAGVQGTVDHHRRCWSRFDAHTAITGYIEQNGRFPTGAELDSSTDLPGSQTLRRLFTTDERKHWREEVYRDMVLRRIRDWNATYGRPPSRKDWQPDRTGPTIRAAVRERYLTGGWPDGARVRDAFGSFEAAVELAGLTPAQGVTPIPGLETTRSCRGCGNAFSQPVRWGQTGLLLYCSDCR